MFCSSYLGVFHFPLLRNQRLITIVSSEASGAAKPMVKRLAPAIPLRIHVAGTRTAKAQKMLFIIVKVVWPQPLKKPLRQKTRQTSTQSMLKDLR